MWKKEVVCPTKRHLWRTLHLHFYVLASSSVLLLPIIVTVPPGTDSLQLDPKSTLTNFLCLGRVQHNFQTTLAQWSCMVYSNVPRPRKDTEKLKAQMEIMAWSPADCGLKCCSSQSLDLPFSLKLKKDTHQHTVHIPEKI